MRKQVSARELPKYPGKTIFLYDEEKKTDEIVEDIRLCKGWIKGKSRHAFVELSLNYNLKKIFIEL